MPQRQLFPGQETGIVKARTPACVLKTLDEKYPGQRSRIIATALEDFLERTKDDLERIAQRTEERTALHVVAKERNKAQDALQRLQRELRAERARCQSLLRSVQMTLRNMPTGERLRVAGLLRRVRAMDVAVAQEQEDVGRRLAELRQGTPEVPHVV